MLREDERFENFVLSIDSIHKRINKIKQDIISDVALKGVHTLWFYEFLRAESGLTAAELAAKTGIDPSLVSREITVLFKGGFLTTCDGGRRKYNSRFKLTERGTLLAQKIAEVALEMQSAVGGDVCAEELEIFYSVLARIRKNIEAIAEKQV